jgi:hypothetical protein
MSEEHTQDLNTSRSFEERVFERFDAMAARFDGIDARFDGIDARLDAIDARLDSLEGRTAALEVQAERRALETKPIWERALSEILEVKLRVDDIARNSDWKIGSTGLMQNPPNLSDRYRARCRAAS